MAAVAALARSLTKYTDKTFDRRRSKMNLIGWKEDTSNRAHRHTISMTVLAVVVMVSEATPVVFHFARACIFPLHVVYICMYVALIHKS